jgi:hypothetical protein
MDPTPPEQYEEQQQQHQHQQQQQHQQQHQHQQQEEQHQQQEEVVEEEEEDVLSYLLNSLVNGENQIEGALFETFAGEDVIQNGRGIALTPGSSGVSSERVGSSGGIDNHALPPTPITGTTAAQPPAVDTAQAGMGQTWPPMFMQQLAIPGMPPPMAVMANALGEGSLNDIDRKKRRLERNRESARQSRRRKKQYVELLEEKVLMLTDESEHIRMTHNETAEKSIQEEKQERLKALASMVENMEEEKPQVVKPQKSAHPSVGSGSSSSAPSGHANAENDASTVVLLHPAQQKMQDAVDLFVRDFGPNSVERQVVRSYHTDLLVARVLAPYTKFLLWMSTNELSLVLPKRRHKPKKASTPDSAYGSRPSSRASSAASSLNNSTNNSRSGSPHSWQSSVDSDEMMMEGVGVGAVVDNMDMDTTPALTAAGRLQHEQQLWEQLWDCVTVDLGLTPEKVASWKEQLRVDITTAVRGTAVGKAGAEAGAGVEAGRGVGSAARATLASLSERGAQGFAAGVDAVSDAAGGGGGGVKAVSVKDEGGGGCNCCNNNNNYCGYCCCNCCNDYCYCCNNNYYCCCANNTLTEARPTRCDRSRVHRCWPCV